MSTTQLSAISDLDHVTLIKSVVNTSPSYGQSPYNFDQFDNLSLEVSYTDNNIKKSAKLNLYDLMQFLSACIYDLSNSPFIKLQNETRDISSANELLNDNGWRTAKLGEFLTKNDSRTDSAFLRVDGNDINSNQPYIRLNNESRKITTNSTLDITSTQGIKLYTSDGGIHLSSSTNSLNINKENCIFTSTVGGISCNVQNGKFAITAKKTNDINTGITLITNGANNNGIVLSTDGNSSSGIALNTSGSDNHGISLSTLSTDNEHGIKLKHNSKYGQILIESTTELPTYKDSPGITFITHKQDIKFDSGENKTQLKNSYGKYGNTLECVATSALWN